MHISWCARCVYIYVSFLTFKNLKGLVRGPRVESPQLPNQTKLDKSSIILLI